MPFDTAFNLRFDRGATGSFLIGDPRMTIARAAGAATAINRRGLIYAVPANTLRARFHPLTGVCEGFHAERQETNLFLQSEDATHAAWTKTSLTPTGDATTAPNNTVTADTLTATGAGGCIAQAVTITPGRGLSVPVFAKAAASSFLWVQVTDGGNTVECWFNLSAGTTGSHTAGAGSCVFSQKYIEAHALGFWRCHLDVNTATSTAFTVKYGPAAADGVTPANANAIHWWGAHASAESNISAAGSYIPTTSATVTRGADNVHLPVDAAWFNPSEGTMFFEFVNGLSPNGVPGGQVMGGVASSFNDVIYLSRVGTSSMRAGFNSGGVGASALDRTWNFTPGAVVKCAIAWAANDRAFVVDGGSPVTSAASYTPPANFVRFGLGCAPWSTSDPGNKPYGMVRAFSYVPRRVTVAEMQLRTAA